MIEETWRSLLFPLGFIANVFFGLRFIIQWLQSEKKKESIVPKNFWFFSLGGNALLSLHAFIQLQYPVLFLQSVGALIALRNLDLLGKKRLSIKQMIMGSGIVLIGITLLFSAQSSTWMRAPLKTISLPAYLHCIGIIGMFLFASRFWLQWWQAEKQQKSTLSTSFWWISLLGASLSLFYFVQLRDPVNILGYSLGIIPYLRNITLIKRKKFTFVHTNTLFILAAEKSGDVLGGKLLAKLRTKLPSTRFVGVGGEEMTKEGLVTLIPSDQFEVMGFVELLPAALRLFSHFHRIKKHILRERPKMVVLIDYAEFNMLLAQALRKGGYRGKIVQYVIPSVWAWRPGRIKKLARDYDLLLSILPFEAAYFEKEKVRVSFVGHPLVETMDHIADIPRKDSLFALFPGSRPHEIDMNLPYQLKAVAHLLQRGATLAISVASEKLKARIEEIAQEANIPYTLIEAKDRYQIMKEATCALSTCGTVILELALLQTPTVVTYKIPYVNYLIGRYLFNISLPYFSLPNIMMKQELFPEYVDKKINYQKLIEMTKRVMDRKREIVEGCTKMRKIFGKNKEADEEIYELFMS